MISIEIPVSWGNHLLETLESIRSQDFQDYEITASVSSKEESVGDILSEYGVKYCDGGYNILSKRYISHKLSKGDYALLLDETRVLGKGVLETLSNLENDMAVIDERDYGDTFWVRASNHDRMNAIELVGRDTSIILDGYVLPRFFRARILTDALERVRRNLSDFTFERVLMEDHQIISVEALKESRDIAIVKNCHIYHHGDTSLIDIARKYYKYGKYNRILKNTLYEKTTRVGNRKRKFVSDNELSVFMLEFARGLPFFAGIAVSNICSKLYRSEWQ